MKYLVIPLILFLAGCTVSSDPALEQELKSVRYELDSCKSTLKAYSVPDTSSTFNPEPEQQQPQEPQCEEVEYNVLTKDGHKLDTCKSQDVGTKECGVMATNCESGSAYACLRDVTYKTITKKICE